MASKFDPLTGAYSLSLTKRSVEVMRRASILEESVGALDSTLSSDSTRTRELDSNLASKNSELDAAAAEHESS